MPMGLIVCLAIAFILGNFAVYESLYSDNLITRLSTKRFLMVTIFVPGLTFVIAILLGVVGLINLFRGEWRKL